MPNTRRFASPTGGRDVVNPQDLRVYFDRDTERMHIEFREGGRLAKWAGTPQMARHVAYLLLMGVANLTGRFVEGDDVSFTVTGDPVVEPITEGNRA